MPERSSFYFDEVDDKDSDDTQDIVKTSSLETTRKSLPGHFRKCHEMALRSRELVNW